MVLGDQAPAPSALPLHGRDGPAGEFVLHRKGDQKVANKAKGPVLKRAFQEHTTPQHWTLREGKFNNIFF